MGLHLKEISRVKPAGRHAVVIMDRLEQADGRNWLHGQPLLSTLGSYRIVILCDWYNLCACGTLSTSQCIFVAPSMSFAIISLQQ